MLALGAALACGTGWGGGQSPAFDEPPVLPSTSRLLVSAVAVGALTGLPLEAGSTWPFPADLASERAEELRQL